MQIKISNINDCSDLILGAIKEKTDIYIDNPFNHIIYASQITAAPATSKIYASPILTRIIIKTGELRFAHDVDKCAVCFEEEVQVTNFSCPISKCKVRLCALC